MRRIGAYGIGRDEAGRLLLVRAGAGSARPGCWLLPGGAVAHGEDPAEAVVREFAEETGLTVTVTGPRDVLAELVHRPPGLEHTDAVVYDVAVTAGQLPPEPAGSTDQARWLTREQARRLPVGRLVGYALGQPPPAVPDQPAVPAVPDQPAGPPRRPARSQRFAAYGLVTDPAGQVLLTQNAAGYPGAGRWHLPGGGTDFGEQPRDGLRREIREESGQLGEVGELLIVGHHRNRAGLGPQGQPIDWHGVRAVFQVTVPAPTVPRVLDLGGSTAQADWFTRAEAADLPLTTAAAEALALVPVRGVGA